MANNSPTNLAKGGEKADKPKTIEELNAEQKVKEGEFQELNAESTEPVVDASAQAAADAWLEQSRGRVFGDITSSNGDSNTRGLHGRDGGIVPEGPSNPVPSEKAQEPEVVEEDEIEAARMSNDDPKT
jgi:hypothetical protein